MSDFFQTGSIATLHRLGADGLDRMEGDLKSFCARTPAALVLPCHVRDLHSPALRGIVAELGKVKYLAEVVLGLDGAPGRADREFARRLFPKQSSLLVRSDGPRVRAVLRRLRAAGVDAGPPGKGRNVWLCSGVVLATGAARVMAAHDCDIVNYERGMLARLVYPVVHPEMGFEFCKGYYARFSDRLNGRVMRLFMSPLLRAMREVFGPLAVLTHLEEFRYALAGEFAMRTELAAKLRMPGDWALEVGVLAEVARVSAGGAICQSELCERYDHKHQALSVRDPGKGLHRAAVDIARTLFARLAADGLRLDARVIAALRAAYVRHAGRALRSYGADAAINGLVFPRHDEEVAVAMFAECTGEAGRAFFADPAGAAPIPSWDEAATAIPGILADLRDAVLADAR